MGRTRSVGSVAIVAVYGCLVGCRGIGARDDVDVTVEKLSATSLPGDYVATPALSASAGTNLTIAYDISDDGVTIGTAHDSGESTPNSYAASGYAVSDDAGSDRIPAVATAGTIFPQAINVSYSGRHHIAAIGGPTLSDWQHALLVGPDRSVGILPLPPGSEANGVSAASSSHGPALFDAVTATPMSTWRFDGAASDEMGANQLPGSGLTYEQGHSGQAAVFNGTTPACQFIAASAANAAGSTGFTVAAWVKPSGSCATRPQPIVQRGLQFSMALACASDNVTPAITGFVNVTNATSSDPPAFSGPSGFVPPGTWNHVAMSWNKSVLRFYVNGQLTRELAQPGTVSGAAFWFYVGCYTEVLRGALDDVALYGEALSAAQISELWTTGVPGGSPAREPIVGGTTPAVGGALNRWPLISDAKDSISQVILTDGVPPQYGVPGHATGTLAAQFNGTTSCLYGPATSATDVGGGDGLTMMAWVKPTTCGAAGERRPIVQRGQQYAMAVECAPDQTTAKLAAMISTDAASPPTYLPAGGTLPLGTWSHVAVTWNKSVVRYYVGGKIIKELPLMANAIAGAAHWSYIGCYTTLFDGSLQDVSVVRHALSPKQVGDDMAGHLVTDKPFSGRQWYRYQAGEIELLAPPEPTADGVVHRMNAAGEMVGSHSSAGTLYATLYRPDHGIEMLEKVVTTSGEWTFQAARAINEAGQVVGSGKRNGVPRGFRAAIDTQQVTELGFPPESTFGAPSYVVVPNAINSQGHVVGAVRSDADTPVHAFVYTDTSGMSDLNDLVAPGSDWVLVDALAINDRDEVVGWAQSAAGARRAYKLKLPGLSSPDGASPVSFAFTMQDDSTTSAGVFTSDHTLIRTLWSAVPYAKGNHIGHWDGRDDDGRLVVSGNYEVRVLGSQANYQWESGGVVGNTSDATTGPGVFHFQHTINSMVVVGPAGNSTAYIAAGSDEFNSPLARFQTATPWTKTRLLSDVVKTPFNKVASDGTSVFWLGFVTSQDAVWTGTGFVMATTIGSDEQVPFTWGSDVGGYKKVIDPVSITGRAGDAEPTGLAVNADYVFVSRRYLSTIRTTSRSSGQSRECSAFIAPGEIALDGNGHIWMIHSRIGVRRVQRFSLTTPGGGGPTDCGIADTETASIDPAQLADPLALAYRNGVLLVVDGGASQQVKAFSDTGSLQWTLGQAGGYATDPAVPDLSAAPAVQPKFDFQPLVKTNGEQGPGAIKPLDSTKDPFVAFEPDGSFWVGDPGCYRMLHFSGQAAHPHIATVAQVPVFYSVAVDPNDPTRVFADYLEFKVDYALPLGPRNGSWKLVRNWRAGIFAQDDSYDSAYDRAKYVATLVVNNARHTYATFASALFELPSSGQPRLIGPLPQVTVPGQSRPMYGSSLYPDGTVRTLFWDSVAHEGIWYEFPLQRFDASANPVWPDNPVWTPTAPPSPLEIARFRLTATDPFDGQYLSRIAVKTSTNVIAAFDATRAQVWHLGGVQVGGTQPPSKWNWKTSPSVPRNYIGPWPSAGEFDTMTAQELAGTAGGSVMAIDRHIIYGYVGEGIGQVNKFRDYYDDGLMVADFGVTHADVSGESPPKMAGNAYSSWVVRANDGRVFLYQNDESYHGGVLRWRLDGIDSVQEQSIPISWSYEATPSGLDVEYFATADWNNLRSTIVGISPQVGVNWPAGPPADTGLASTATTYSIRWSGYLLPPSNPPTDDTYTFAVTANVGVARLSIDGQPVTGPVRLARGVHHPLTLEYQRDSTSTAATTVAVEWSWTGQTAVAIPSSSFRHSHRGRAERVDLLAGLPADAYVDGDPHTGAAHWPDTYGWTVGGPPLTYPAWYVATNQKTTNLAHPDIGMRLQTAGEKTFSRDLGTPNNRTRSWSIDMLLNYDGTVLGAGQATIEVLDDTGSGEVIATVAPSLMPDNHVQMFGNGVSLVPDTRIIKWHSLRVSAANGHVHFQYDGRDIAGPLAPRCPAAKWWRPKMLRIKMTSTNGATAQLFVDDLTFASTL